MTCADLRTNVFILSLSLKFRQERARARAVDQAAEIPEIGNRILFSFLLILGTSRAELEIGSLIEFKLRSQAHMGAYSPPVTPP